MATPEKLLTTYMIANWNIPTIAKPLMYNQKRNPSNHLPNKLYASSELSSPFAAASIGSVYYHKIYNINIQILAATDADVDNYIIELERLFEDYNQSISGGQCYISNQTIEEIGKKKKIEYNLDYQKYE